jgi:hypothetical protein
MPGGGHFPSVEAVDVLAAEIRAVDWSAAGWTSVEECAAG